MSFAGDIKTELCKIKPSGCCAAAELYGIFLFSRNFSENTEFFVCDRIEIAERVLAIIKQLYGFLPKLTENDNSFSLSADYIGVGRIFADFLSVNYITDIFVCEKCFQSFVRGAFLSGGTATDPKRSFHAEIKTKNETAAISTQAIFEAQGFNAHLSKRQNYHLVYFKGGESVSDFLTLIGATKKALEVIDAAMLREMRNRVNRGKNCETANITKTVNAAVRQNKAIKQLESTGRLSMLSEELQAAAKLRFSNPELSLGELSRLCGISRSGLNHRLNRLVAIAEDDLKIKNNKKTE